MMNKSLLGDGEESSGKDFYGFRAVRSVPMTSLRSTERKKSRRYRRLMKLINREASNRVDRSHSVSNTDAASDKGESLIVRKRTDSFREH